MNRILLLVVAMFLVACGQEPYQVPASPEGSTPEVEPSSATLKAEEQARKQMALITANEAVQGFRVMRKRYPENLSELAERGFFLPDLPEGMRFSYDPESGAVDIEEGVPQYLVEPPADETE